MKSNSIKKLEEEKSSLFIEQRTLRFILNEIPFKIKTSCREGFENQKSILIREYWIPLLFGEKFISDVVNNYVGLVNDIIKLQNKTGVFLVERL